MNNGVITVKSGFFIEGIGLVPRVKGLHRTEQGSYGRWMVTPSNDSTCKLCYFPDKEYGSPVAAYKAAMEYIHSHGELLAAGTVKTLKERCDKKIKLGVPGVMVRYDERTSARYCTVRVSAMAEVPEVRFYVGKVDDEGINLRNTILLGKNERRKTEGKYRHKRHVPLADVMPWKVAGI